MSTHDPVVRRRHLSRWRAGLAVTVRRLHDVAELMVPGEQPVAAYRTFRDNAVFTTKRLIVRDAQGMTGRKVEVYSLRR